MAYRRRTETDKYNERRKGWKCGGTYNLKMKKGTINRSFLYKIYTSYSISR